ncbi:MAG: hypothetical protein EZS28_044127 [Streblomastix strix]|uniref:Uncharacterized protein n=1 Tax=Streblomastix strix TaxID=222440 RepID=A0A5J4TQ63_9EUKA|nr:MAG: hypothetical protein EZS28_044127 [Streblomastix strix]
MVLVKSTMKAKRKQPRKLAECDELFLIQEMAITIKSSKAGKARKIVALVKIYSIKNASDVIFGWISRELYTRKLSRVFIGRHKKKLGIKEDTARQQQRMKVKIEDVDAFQEALKKCPRQICKFICNADKIGIQAYCDNRPQCVIVPSEYMDDEIHFSVDCSELRASAMVAIALNGLIL